MNAAEYLRSSPTPVIIREPQQEAFLHGDREQIVRLRSVMQTSVEVLLREVIITDQGLTLLPASRNGLAHSQESGGYENVWTRDNMITAAILTDPQVLANLPEGVRQQAERLGYSLALSFLDIYARPGNRELFDQEIRITQNSAGYPVTQLTREAPPVHFDRNGNRRNPWNHNQPDSFGELLVVVARGLQRGGLVEQELLARRDTIEAITNYLIRIQPSIFESSAMWEMDPVGNPSSTSTVSAIITGLEAMLPVAEKVGNISQTNIEETINTGNKFLMGEFPRDYTSREGHFSTEDLGTLVVMSCLDGMTNLDFMAWFDKANQSLGNTTPGEGMMPGKLRFIGDGYDPIFWQANPAYWFMALPAEAIEFAKLAQRAYRAGNQEAGMYYEQQVMGRLDKANSIYEEAEGYYPEMFVWNKQMQELVRHRNALLWNEALMTRAAAFAIQTIQARVAA